MSPVCKMADNGRLTVDQNVKFVFFCAETKSVVATQRLLQEVTRQNVGHIEMFFITNNFPAYED
jgi:hypothetical protein